MKFKTGFVTVMLVAGLVSPLFGQGSAPQQPTQEQSIEKAQSAVAMVLARRTAADAGVLGVGLVVHSNGVLLTAHHLIKDAQFVQVRLKNGEIFDQVQLLGVDPRRDVAAIRIAGAGLPVIPIAVSPQAGESVGVISHPDGLAWSAAAGVVGGLRLADEVPGAGNGYKLVEFTAATPRAANGGVLVDSRGNALALVVSSMTAGQNAKWAVPISNVIGLADSPITKVVSNSAMAMSVQPRPTDLVAVPNAPEKSDVLSASKDRDFILRNFKTMYVNANRAKHFGSEQLKAQLGRNEDFAKLNIQIVDDPRVADVVLEVGYTFAWDYPFQLKHQNTTFVLLSGKGLGPFSGIAGAASVAEELAKAAKPYRGAPKK